MKQYSPYLGRVIDFSLTFLVHCTVSVIACGILFLMLALRKYCNWRLEVATTRLAICGASFGACVALPGIIDLAVSNGSVDRWGAPVGSVIGTIVSWGVVLGAPLALGWWLTRRGSGIDSSASRTGPGDGDVGI